MKDISWQQALVFFDHDPRGALPARLLMTASVLVLAACSSAASPNAGNTAGAGQTGGTQANASGGMTASGGGGSITGGTASSLGNTSGVPQTGGALGVGGTRASGGSTSNDTVPPTGGSKSAGGTLSTGGVAAGGDTSSNATGGMLGTGGASPTGGSKSAGGTSALAGSSSVASGGTAAAGSTSTGPCDIYGAANAPCVAAHSTVRALYGAYAGNLYQVRRASDKTTKDIPVQSPGGYANASVQDSFCNATTCTISIIYDQSPKANHLTKAPVGGWLNNGGLEANATAAKITLNGHTVYGVYTTGSFDNNTGGVGYRNNSTQGVPTGDQAESMYMVASGKHYNQWCCFDYGNAETNNKDNGPATMEAVYFGNSTQWGKGSGTGPWVMADLEDGVFAGGSFAAPASNTTISADFVTALLKGYSGNRFVLKGGSAQSGALALKYDGARPSGYSPQKKEGAIILGIGGDNSHAAEGTFFEGVMTAGVPTDAADDAVQANIVAAGYGK